MNENPTPENNQKPIEPAGESVYPAPPSPLSEDLPQGGGSTDVTPVWPSSPPVPPELPQDGLEASSFPAPPSPPGWEPQDASCGQYPQEAPYPQPYSGDPGYPPPKTGRRPVFIALIIVAALFVTGIVGVFVFKDAILLRTNPEAYLAQAITKTTIAFSESTQIFPDYSKFQGRPTTRELTVKLKEMPGLPYMYSLEDSYLKLSAKSDMEARRLLLEFSFQIPELQLNDNKLYVSEDALGLEVPALLSKYGMITIDPSNFIPDWNKSTYAYFLSEIPEDFDLSAGITELFDAFESVDTSEPRNNNADTDYEERMDRIVDAFKSASTVVYNGEASLPLGKSAKTYKDFTRTFPKESAKAFLLDSLDLMMEAYQETVINNYPGSSYYGDPAYQMEEMMIMLDRLEITEDVVCHFYLNDSGRWSRLRMPSIQFSMPYDEGGVPYDYVISLDLSMEGNTNPLDDLLVEIVFSDLYLEEKVTLTLAGETALTGGVATSDWRLAVDDESGYSSGEMTLHYAWDQNAVSGENFKVSLGYEDEYSPFSMTMAGNLVETGGSVSFSDVKLNLEADHETMAFELAYLTKEIDPGELDLAGFLTTNLFDIDPMTLMEELQTSIYALTDNQ